MPHLSLCPVCAAGIISSHSFVLSPISGRIDVDPTYLLTISSCDRSEYPYLRPTSSCVIDATACRVLFPSRLDLAFLPFLGHLGICSIRHWAWAKSSLFFTLPLFPDRISHFLHSHTIISPISAFRIEAHGHPHSNLL